MAVLEELPSEIPTGRSIYSLNVVSLLFSFLVFKRKKKWATLGNSRLLAAPSEIPTGRCIYSLNVVSLLFSFLLFKRKKNGQLWATLGFWRHPAIPTARSIYCLNVVSLFFSFLFFSLELPKFSFYFLFFKRKKMGNSGQL